MSRDKVEKILFIKFIFIPHTQLYNTPKTQTTYIVIIKYKYLISYLNSSIGRAVVLQTKGYRFKPCLRQIIFLSRWRNGRRSGLKIHGFIT